MDKIKEEISELKGVIKHTLLNNNSELLFKRILNLIEQLDKKIDLLQEN